MTFLFISHHLQEIYEICDTVTVFRDARHILTAPVAELPPRRAGRRDDRRGRRPDDRRSPAGRAGRRPVGARRRATCRRRRVRRTSSFSVRAGEIVGLAGSRRQRQDRGRRDRRRAARRRRRHGRVDGRRSAAGQRARRAGRRASGSCRRTGTARASCPMLSIAENATLTVAATARPRRRSSAGRRRDALAARHDRRPGDQDARARAAGVRPVRRQPAEGRHGPGAGQRPAAAGPHQPDRRASTCGPRSSCSARSRRSPTRGTGVLIVSDELDDLRICDRVLVMFQGRVVAEMPRGWHDHDLVAAMEGVDHRCLTPLSETDPRRRRRPPAAARRAARHRARPAARPRPGPGDHRHRDRRPDRQPGLPAAPTT